MQCFSVDPEVEIETMVSRLLAAIVMTKRIQIVCEIIGIENNHELPVAIETLGSYGPYALDFIKDIGRRIKESTGEKRATSYLMQTIGIAIQRGNSQCILSTVKDSRKMDEVYYL